MLWRTAVLRTPEVLEPGYTVLARWTTMHALWETKRERFKVNMTQRSTQLDHRYFDIYLNVLYDGDYTFYGPESTEFWAYKNSFCLLLLCTKICRNNRNIIVHIYWLILFDLGSLFFSTECTAFLFLSLCFIFQLCILFSFYPCLFLSWFVWFIFLFLKKTSMLCLRVKVFS